MLPPYAWPLGSLLHLPVVIAGVAATPRMHVAASGATRCCRYRPLHPCI